MKGIVLVADHSEQTIISLQELCVACEIPENELLLLIEFDIIQPIQQKNNELYFATAHIHRIKTALRLQHDLELNLTGVAIILDLLDELHDMQSRLALLEKYSR